MRAPTRRIIPAADPIMVGKPTPALGSDGVGAGVVTAQTQFVEVKQLGLRQILTPPWVEQTMVPAQLALLVQVLPQETAGVGVGVGVVTAQRQLVAERQLGLRQILTPPWVEQTMLLAQSALLVQVSPQESGVAAGELLGLADGDPVGDPEGEGLGLSVGLGEGEADERVKVRVLVHCSAGPTARGRLEGALGATACCRS